MIAAVLLALFVASALYALFLQRIHDLYSPDYVWLTVVGGDGLILGAMLVLAFSGELPWLAFWVFAGGFVAAGLPIIVWQIWQTASRRQSLERWRRDGTASTRRRANS